MVDLAFEAPGQHEESDHHGELHDNQHLAQPHAEASAGGRAAGGQHLGRLEAGQDERRIDPRRQTEQQDAAHHQRQEAALMTVIEAEIEPAEGVDDRQAQLHDRQAGDRRGQGHQQRLAQELHAQLRTGRAQGAAHRHLAGPHARPRRRQIDEIDGGDEEGQQTDQRQRHHRGAGLLVAQMQFEQLQQAQGFGGMPGHARPGFAGLAVDEGIEPAGEMVGLGLGLEAQIGVERTATPMRPIAHLPMRLLAQQPDEVEIAVRIMRQIPQYGGNDIAGVRLVIGDAHGLADDIGTPEIFPRHSLGEHDLAGLQSARLVAGDNRQVEQLEEIGVDQLFALVDHVGAQMHGGVHLQHPASDQIGIILMQLIEQRPHADFGEFLGPPPMQPQGADLVDLVGVGNPALETGLEMGIETQGDEHRDAEAQSQ